MGWYKAGTVFVTKNSTAVVGTGTAFLANARVGDGFRGPDGAWYEVDNIVSNTTLSIVPGYLGATAAAGAYAIMPVQGYNKDSADALRQASIAMGQVAGQKGLPDGIASLDSAGQVPSTQLPTTDKITEGVTNRWWTNARTIASTLAGMVVTNPAVVLVTDSILAAIGKLQAQITLGGWGGPKAAVAADINALTSSQQFNISTANSLTLNVPLKFGSATTYFDAGSTGICSMWTNSSSGIWQALMFDRTSSSVVLRRKALGTVFPDDYLVVYPTGKTVLDVAQLPAMSGATATVAGKSGLVPAPAAGDQAKFLAGDGTYKSISTSVSWGAIGGTLSAQTDLQSALDAKASKTDPRLPSAYVTFSGSAGTPSVRGALNVSSVVRNGLGDYTINFTSPMSSASNYTFLAALSQSNFDPGISIINMTATSLRISTVKWTDYQNVVMFDFSTVCVTVFGG